MLPQGALVDERTQLTLGEDALDEVLGCLWLGDCQTCGGELGADPPAVRIDDLGIVTRASLHHATCQAPSWNDSLLVTAPSDALVSWRSVVLLLPLETG